jgi:ribose transport system substrate-binding protein
MHPRVWLQKRAVLGLVATAVALAVAACGSSSSSSVNGSASNAAATGSASGSASSGADLAALKAVVAAHVSANHIGPTAPIGKPIPRGKTIVYVNCGQPACTLQGDGLQAAAKVLGWNVTTINTQPTPEAVQAAFDQVIRDHPDGVASAGLGRSLYARELDQLNSMHIPVLSATGEQETGQGGITYDPIGPSEAAHYMSVLADKAIVDMNGQGQAGSVLLGGFPIVKLYTAGWTNEIKAKCPKCTQAQLVIQPTDLGKDSATLITNFVRANPGMKALYLSYGLESEGLTAAAKGAGITLPALYGWAPDNSQLPLLQSGEWKAAAVDPNLEIGWQWADAFARLFTGGSVAADKAFPQAGIIWSKDYNNVPAAANPFPAIDPNYQTQYESLWGVK